MRSFHFYDASTGVLHASSIVVNAPEAEKSAEGNCPPGHKAIEGTFDPLSQRVDVETGAVIDYQPPQPSADHEWNADSKRWQLSAAAHTKIQERAAQVLRIAHLELSQHRFVREYVLGIHGAAEKIKAIDDEITNIEAQQRAN